MKPFELIPLTIQTRGEVITSNVDEVRDLVRAALTNINRDLKTDEDFGQAVLDVKQLKGVEESFTAAKEKALKDAEALHVLFATIDTTVEEVRKPRLELEKLITKRKEEVKAELIAEAMGKLDCAPRLRQNFSKTVSESIKGKQNLDSMRKALDVIVSCLNANIAKGRAHIASFEKAHGVEMTMDREELEVKSPDSVEAELRRRFEAKKAADEKRRLEEEAAEARAAESKAKAEAEAAKREVEAAKEPQPTNVVPMKGMLPPDTLPKPPKIDSIPVGSAAIANQAQAVTLTEEQEWAQIMVTVKTSFALIKEHRERLVHEPNKKRIFEFGVGVNALWKEVAR